MSLTGNVARLWLSDRTLRRLRKQLQRNTNPKTQRAARLCEALIREALEAREKANG